MKTILDNCHFGVKSVDGLRGYYQICYGGEPLGKPVRGFANAMDRMRKHRSRYRDGVESAGAAQLLQGRVS